MTELRRVLIVSEPGKDGVFVFVRSLVRHLHRVHPGVIVDLAYSTRRELGGATELAAEVCANGGEAIDLGVSNLPEVRDFSALQKIHALVRRNDPQIVHAHSSKAGVLCRALALLPGFPPVIYTPNAYYGVARKGGGREAVYNAIESICGHIGLTACCSSDEYAFAVEVLHIPPSRLVTICNGIDTHVFAPATNREKQVLRAELGIPPDGHLLVTVGRHSAQKNYGPLYAALAHLLPSAPDLRFAHAGEGSVELVAGLPEAARARAIGFNQLSNPQALMRAADGFVLVSRYEGLSLSMLEALSCGAPTILTDIPGLKSIRELGFCWTRWLPPPSDQPEFVDAIEQGIVGWNDGDQTPIEAQRVLVLKYFDQDKQFEEMFGLYESRA